MTRKLEAFDARILSQDGACETGLRHQLLTESEAASLLTLSVKTLRNWRVSGKGPRFVRLSGRAIRYRRSDLEAFIDAGVRKSTSDHGGDCNA
jgi:excisionase family DNA binding protein